MKISPFFIISLLLISFGTNTVGQDLEVGDKWYYGVAIGMPCYEEYELYEIINDTIIDDQTCFVMQKTFYRRSGSVSITPQKEIIYQAGSKLYVRKNDEFHVVFDYTAEKGDTITVMDESFEGFFGLKDEYAPYELFQYEVDKVDTMKVNGHEFKRLTVSGTEESDWLFAEGTEILENIGRYSGDYTGTIFGFPKFTVTVGGFCDLRCFNDISFVDYPCDNLGPISFIESNPKQSDLFFYPSVIMDQFTLTRDFEKVCIYNLKGQKQLEIKPAGQGDYRLDQLGSGVYLLKIEDKGKEKVFKIIKK